MLPRKLHIEQINKFHNKMESTKLKINEIIDDNSQHKLCGELCLQYTQMLEIWNKIDNLVEMEVKIFLDTNP